MPNELQSGIDSLNNTLYAIKGVLEILKAVSSLNKKEVELQNEGWLDTEKHFNSSFNADNAQTHSSQFAENLQKQGFKTFNFYSFYKEEVMYSLEKNGAHAVICQGDKPGVLTVCYPSCDEKIIDKTLQMLNEHAKGLPTSHQVLESIAQGRNDNILTATNLSDEELFLINQNLPKYQIPYNVKMTSNGKHEIDFLASNQKVINRCYEEIKKDAEKGVSQDKIYNRNFTTETFKVLASELKKDSFAKEGKPLYVVSFSDKGNDSYMKIEPNQITMLTEDSLGDAKQLYGTEPLVGKISSESSLSYMKIQVSAFNKPIVLTEDEFNKFMNAELDIREQICEEKYNLIDERIPQVTLSPDEIYANLYSKTEKLSTEPEKDTQNIGLEELE